jgi:hypothetical protein
MSWIFWTRVNFLIAASRFDALDRFLFRSEYTMFPAFFPRVYFAPVPNLCSARRRARSVVMPQ